LHPNLQFECGDATTLQVEAQFDIVTAARTLQWIAEPALAVSKMKEAAKPNGSVVVLDYNHLHNQWDPEPPREFKLFTTPFWRGGIQIGGTTRWPIISRSSFDPPEFGTSKAAGRMRL